MLDSVLEETLVERLERLTRIILDPNNDYFQLRPEIKEMEALFNEARSPQPEADHPNDGEVFTPNGLAVSARWAELCMDDQARTIQFLRGAHAAIEEVRQTAPDRPARLLYAGCGPYATLVVPLMSVLTPADVEITLIEFHPGSMASARSLITNLGYLAFVRDFIVMDAADYVIGPDNTPDIILMEVMQSCLNKEPQVAVSRHLIEQAPDAILIPQQIDVELSRLSYVQDICEDSNFGVSDPISLVFRLDKAAIERWRGIDNDVLPAERVTIPDLAPSSDSLALSTRIITYGEHTLSGTASGLTIPRYHSCLADAPFGKRVEFAYRLGASPSLFVASVEES